jgi:hypothetical protein
MATAKMTTVMPEVRGAGGARHGDDGQGGCRFMFSSPRVRLAKR